MRYLTRLERWLGHRCLLCLSRNPERRLCHACAEQLPHNTPACALCAMPCPRPRCGQCLIHPPPFNLIAPYRYQTPINHMIAELKFNASLTHAHCFGELLGDKIDSEYQRHELPEVIIPVALGHQRFISRGFNQSVEIAKPLAKRLNLAIDTSICQRVRETQTQTTLPLQERKRNVQDAFLFKASQYRHIALVDDVVTTSSTIKSVVKAAHQSGIEQVEVWAIARAI